MNIFLNEYFGFWFELNFELNHFSARFNEKINFQNVSPTPKQMLNIIRSQLLNAWLLCVLGWGSHEKVETFDTLWS